MKRYYKLGKWSLLIFVFFICIYTFADLYLDNWFIKKPITIFFFLIILTGTVMLPFVFWNYEKRSKLNQSGLGERKNGNL
jgi:hypothetical protein